MSRWLRPGLALLALLSALVGWGFLIEPARLVVHRETLELPRWPAELRGLKVALLSDLHVGSPHWGLDHLRELVVRTNAEEPDLVLLAGDYVVGGLPGGRHVRPEAIGAELGELRAPLGVVAALGNHDWAFDGPRVTRAFTQAGIVVLDDALWSTTFHGRKLFVAGLADLEQRPQHVRQVIDRAPAGEALLALVHEPDVFDEIDSRVALTLAGHTHGGQVKLPLIGRPIVPSEYGERYAAGHVVEHGRHLFVTTGVGTSILPVRFGVPPELVILTLR